MISTAYINPYGNLDRTIDIVHGRPLLSGVHIIQGLNAARSDFIINGINNLQASLPPQLMDHLVDLSTTRIANNPRPIQSSYIAQFALPNLPG